MSTASDRAHHAQTIKSCLDETDNLIRDCRHLLTLPETVAQLSDGKVEDARRLREFATSLRYWLASRRY